MEVPEPESTDVPITAVPHLMNEKLLAWHQAHHDGLKAIYDKLDEILIVLKEK